MFEMFCGRIWNYVTVRLSAFHPLRSVFPLYFMSHIIMLLLHVWVITHVLLWSCAAFFWYIFLSMQAWFLSLLNFTSLRGSKFRWVLNQLCATHFICELKEPPAGHVFIFSLLVIWVENNLSWGYRLCNIPSLRWLLAFNLTNFHIRFIGFPLETLTPTLTKFRLMWSELFLVDWWEQLPAYIEFSLNWY